MIDKRYTLIKNRLSKLTCEEIQRIINDIDLVCFDTFNYDSTHKKYCPLAVAMNLHHTIKNPTDQSIKKEIEKRFMPVNVISGVYGNFYRENRKDDIIQICKEILKNELYSS